MQPDVLAPSDTFARRHIGPSRDDVTSMLAALGYQSLDELTAATVPAGIRLAKPLALGAPLAEHEMLEALTDLAADNQVLRSFIGQGYYDTITPGVILRNVLENPGWYTQYTPYQAEISQGRLEALINFQTMVEDLTALPMANASLLDEATAAAEAMHMCFGKAEHKRAAFWVHDATHPQTINVMRTRAEPLGIVLHVAPIGDILAKLDGGIASAGGDIAGVLFSYPTTDGQVIDLRDAIAKVHAAGASACVATDLLALALLVPPGELGADIAIGSAQRFGVPMGFGGPHAAFLSAKDDFRRQMPGRIIGVSRDAKGKPAFRLALQTREQHIRREKATSNICTAQVLLAVMASMYAVYHGPDGIKRIAERVRAYTALVAAGLERIGTPARPGVFFDTLRVDLDAHQVATLMSRAVERGINVRRYSDGVGISCDETTTLADVSALLDSFRDIDVTKLVEYTDLPELPVAVRRTSAYLTHPTFNRYHAEHEMLRYINRLCAKDLSLTTSMIPLGSCTMKLNATTEMEPVTWPAIGRIHPFAPAEQWGGYRALFAQLEAWLAEITGLPAVSLQPNSGAQGEYAGLLAIRGYHRERGDAHRDVCLIPQSAHGTNPASAVMAGMTVVVVASAADGTIDLADLRAKATQYEAKLGALMVTYPSTHGVFEEGIREVCSIVHAHGGQVYMDGANMNAQLGLTRPAECGADVCHLNLHKTFCCVAGTPVAVPTGIARPIEKLVRGESVYGWSEPDGGVRSARLDATFRTGRKPCVQITLQDGRTIVCTPDHRVRTTDGWIEAGKLIATHRIVMGPDLPVDDGDDAGERSFRVDCSGLVLAMDTPTERDRTLAFFRIVGATCSDGTFSGSQQRGRFRPTIRLYLGTRYDAERVVDDIQVVCGQRPTISKQRAVFAIKLPDHLVRAIASLDGMGEPGRRIASTRTVPDLITRATTPLSVVREFLAALFGGDGCAPVIVHLVKAPPTLKPVRFVQSHLDPTILAVAQRQICEALARLGVNATADRITRAPSSKLDNPERPRWSGPLTIVDSLAFAERVGFRYCAHKTARLSAAAAFWRMKRTVNAQRVDVAERAVKRVGTAIVRSGPKSVWATAVNGAYEEIAAEVPILSPYYASFAGTKRVSRQVLVNAIDGQKSPLPGKRTTHRRILAAATGRGGDATGVLGVKDFLADIGALSWFNKHTPKGQSYKVTYAVAQDAVVEPTFHLAVVDVRSVGTREVYDLTVDGLHSFLANGAVVHNCIPHGGGGPGMGPIAVAAHLAPFLPGHPLAPLPAGGAQRVGPVSAAPWGSASILPISFAYIAMMGEPGLKRATEIAILNANYIAHRLGTHYPVLYTGAHGRVAHELILDCRQFKKTSGIEVEDIAKRLMDYGFHAPTMSFPVPGTLMVEPTESEAKVELDRFCDAMIAIRAEIAAIEAGTMDRANNPLKNAPHTAAAVAATEWDRPYSREQAVFPAPWLRAHKYWPPVGRVDNAYGDRNLVCACPPVDAYG